MNKGTKLKSHLDKMGAKTFKPPKLSVSKAKIIEELGKIIDKANEIREEHKDEFRAMGI